jgi:L-alanine-DL-glutamate epimerase-like enolase superfamily enzyme
MPNCVMLECPIMDNPLQTELFVEPLVVEDGHVLPPQAPGLGIALTEEMLSKYQYVPGSASLFG